MSDLLKQKYHFLAVSFRVTCDKARNDISHCCRNKEHDVVNKNEDSNAHLRHCLCLICRVEAV